MVRYCNCGARASYNYPGKTSIYCKTHKLSDMVNVNSKKCIVQGCSVRAIFNLSGEKPKYCKEHKTIDMINADAKKCIVDGCNVQPRFNDPGEIIGIYCDAHKIQDMINVVDPPCLFDDCQSRPRYNLPSESNGIYCKTHKLPGMMNVKDIVCRELDCEKIPKCNIPGESNGIYCSTHRTPDMIDVISKRCMTHLCDTFASMPKYRGYCLRCFIYTFPDEPITRNYKVKENHVTDFIKAEFPEETKIFDKTIIGGCSKRRPDCYIDKGNYVVVIECDEFQHQNTACESKRIMEIFKDFGVPVVFIRFNPDSYTKSGKKIASCFKILKQTGVQVISNEKAWKSRLTTLKTAIQGNLDDIPDKEITIVNLFYDN
jgi:hypothetical protein